MRNNGRHRSDVDKMVQCTTKIQRQKKEAELGCHFSSLLDLPYFRNAPNSIVCLGHC